MAFGDFVRSAVSSGTSGSATTPTLSVGATAGNLLILCLSRSTSGGTFPTPSGYTSISGVNTGNLAAQWWWFIATGGETTVSLSGETGTLGNWRMVLAEFEGAFAASPFDVSGENEGNVSTVVTSQDTTPSAAGVTTTQADALAIAYFASDAASNVDGSRTYGSSFTERVFESAVTNSTRAGVALASRVLTATGTYDCTFSVTDTGDEQYGAIGVWKKSVAAGTAGGPILQGRALTPGRIFGGSSLQ